MSENRQQFSEKPAYGDLKSLLVQFDEPAAPIGEGLQRLMTTIVALDHSPHAPQGRRY